MASSGSFDGTISSGEFRAAASALVERWKNSGDSALPLWSWVSPPQQPWLLDQGYGYLAMEKLCLPRPSKEDDNNTTSCAAIEDSCRDADVNDDPIVDDNATLVESRDPEMTRHYYDFHVVYSSSYRVPVLYFRVYCCDGQPVALDEFEGDLPVGSVDYLLKSKWTFITQEEHPFLNQPWYKLHPCGTSEWLKLLCDGIASVQTRESMIELFLISWFSYVGQVFGLGISSDMMKNKKNPPVIS